jgi:hypothetical protein
LELHQEVFTWVLGVITEAGLVQGDRIGVDASTMEANAAMRTIVRKETGEGYRQMLHRMAKESGINTPTNEDLSRMDRQRKGKKTSNKDWESPTDSDAKIARMRDGRTRLAYKPEHAVDLDTGAVVGVDVHPADRGDTKTTPAQYSRSWMTASGRRGSWSQSATDSTGGTATTMPSEPFITTEYDLVPAKRSNLQNGELNSPSAVFSTSLIGAECAKRGYGAAKTSRQWP